MVHEVCCHFDKSGEVFSGEMARFPFSFANRRIMIINPTNRGGRRFVDEYEGIHHDEDKYDESNIDLNNTFNSHGLSDDDDSNCVASTSATHQDDDNNMDAEDADELEFTPRRSKRRRTLNSSANTSTPNMKEPGNSSMSNLQDPANTSMPNLTKPAQTSSPNLTEPVQISAPKPLEMVKVTYATEYSSRAQYFKHLQDMHKLTLANKIELQRMRLDMEERHLTRELEVHREYKMAKINILAKSGSSATSGGSGSNGSQ